MPTEFKKRPILFSGPMIRAILEGRKHQTRRVVKPQPIKWHTVKLAPYQLEEEPGVWSPLTDKSEDRRCPYGVPGDRLWVRETFALVEWTDAHRVTEKDHVLYRADDPNSSEWRPEDGDRWKPSIFMPRWASRITLEVTEVRVERLQDISEEDVRAEGISADSASQFVGHGHPIDDTAWIIAYADLWNHINGKKYPWESNVWVWAISFKRVK